MNAEQKQRAQAALAQWWATNSNKAVLSTGYEMVGLLQELIDAPEPEPVATVTGYYAGYLSISTVDGRVLPAGTALYLAPPAPSVPDAWRGLTDVEWMNIVNFDRAYSSYDKEGAVNEAVKRTEAKLKELNAAQQPEPPAELVRDAERHRACNGSNCGCTDGISHSDECISEHDAIVNEAALTDHVEHGGWKCFGCGYDGQDNQRYNRICARCGVHR